MASTEATAAFNATVNLSRVHTAAWRHLRSMMAHPLPEVQDARRMVECWKAVVWQSRGVAPMMRLVCSLNVDLERDVAGMVSLEALLVREPGHADVRAAIAEAFSAVSEADPVHFVSPAQLYMDTIEILGIVCSAWPRSTRHKIAFKVAPMPVLSDALALHTDDQRTNSLSNPDAAMNRIFTDLGLDFEQATMQREAREVCIRMNAEVGLSTFAPRMNQSDIHRRAELLAKRNLAIREHFGARLDGIFPEDSAERRTTSDVPPGLAGGSALRGRPAGAPTNCGPDLDLCEHGPRFDSPYTIHGGFAIFNLLACTIRLAHVLATGTGVRHDIPITVSMWSTATLWEVYEWLAAMQRQWLGTSLLLSSEYLEVILAVIKRLHVLSTCFLLSAEVSPTETRRRLLTLFGVVERVDAAAVGGDFIVTNAAVQGLGAVAVDILRDVLGVHFMLSVCRPRRPHDLTPEETLRQAANVDAATEVSARSIRADELNVYASRRGYHGFLRPGSIEAFSQRNDARFTEVYRPPPYTSCQCAKIIGFTKRDDAKLMDTVSASTPMTNLVAARTAFPETACPPRPIDVSSSLDKQSMANWLFSPLATTLNGAAPRKPHFPEMNSTAGTGAGAGAGAGTGTGTGAGVRSGMPAEPSAEEVFPITVIAMQSNPSFAATLPVFMFFADVCVNAHIDCGPCIMGQQDLLGHYLAKSGPFNPRNTLLEALAPPLIISIGGPVLAVVFRGRTRVVTASAPVAAHTWCTLVLNHMQGMLPRGEDAPLDCSAYLRKVLGIVHVPRSRGLLTDNTCTDTRIGEPHRDKLHTRLETPIAQPLRVISESAKSTSASMRAFNKRDIGLTHSVSALSALDTDQCAAAAARPAAATGRPTDHLVNVLTTSQYMETNGVLPDAHASSISTLPSALRRHRVWSHRSRAPPGFHGVAHSRLKAAHAINALMAQRRSCGPVQSDDRGPATLPVD